MKRLKKRDKGLFITFEGGEGAGKTTLIHLVVEELKKKGLPLLQTRAPGGTPFGEHIRELLLHFHEWHPSKKAELLLFLADRAEHVDKVIRPALEKGEIVLCDRFNDSTIAYQGASGVIPSDDLRFLCDFASSQSTPDLTFLLDLDPEVGLERARSDGDVAHDRIEKEEIAFHIKVREGYHQLAKAEPERFCILDATLPPNEIFQLAIQKIEYKLKMTLCSP